MRSSLAFAVKSSSNSGSLPGQGVTKLAEEELVVGSSVPEFKLPATTGGEISITDYRGKKVILFFVREYI